MSFITNYDIYVSVLELYLLFSLCIILIFGVVYNSSKKYGHPLVIMVIHFFVIQISLFGILIQYSNILIIMNYWNNMLISNFFLHELKIIIMLVFLGWLILCFFYLKEELITSFEYNILTILGLIGTLFILQANDLLSLYLSIELQSLVFYILVSFKRTSEFATEAGLKYFVLGSFSSSLLLFGNSFMYTITGTTNLENYTKLLTGFSDCNFVFSAAVITSLTFIIAGLLFKLGSAPFHLWLPDVYEGAPTITTVFLIVIPKISLAVLLFKIFIINFQEYYYLLQKIILYSSIFSLFIGSLGALKQIKWKRFIAYSSITHVGFILLGYLSNNNFSFFCILLYTLIYIFTTISLFAFILSLRKKSFFKSYQSRYIDDITGLSILNPILSLMLVIIFFSMAGIPPLSGFFTKTFILFNMLQNGVYGATILAILFSCITSFYYIRIIKTVYFVKPKKLPFFKQMEKYSSFVISIVLFILSLMFLELNGISLFLQELLVSI